jgi:hypothetical protein
MRTAVVRKDERRAEKLRQVGRRIKNGSSMVAQMTPLKRAALVRRHHRRWRPCRERAREARQLEQLRAQARHRPACGGAVVARRP